jgi:hypothetical protein
LIRACNNNFWQDFLIKNYLNLINSINRIFYLVYHNNKDMDNKITLGYWGIRGLAQTPRLILAYSGLNWQDHRYASREEWFDKDKK